MGLKVMAVDDEKILLEDFLDILHEIPEIEVAEGFTGGSDAVRYAQTHALDVAFLDIQMRGMDGITLGKRLQEIDPEINLIFLTAYPEFSLDAIQIHASGYLLKPADTEAVRRELQSLRRPESAAREKRVRIQTFGSFEIYIDEIPCVFHYAKTKELLAYLVDREGAPCTNGELMALLWENHADDAALASNLRNLISDLMTQLESRRCEDVIIRKRGETGIVPDRVICDYYSYRAGDPAAVNAYQGEYMNQYSWGEEQLGNLMHFES